MTLDDNNSAREIVSGIAGRMLSSPKQKAVGRAAVGEPPDPGSHQWTGTVHAGGSVNQIDRSWNPRIVFGGGGILLSIVAAIVWTQYSEGADKDEAKAAYQASVVAACDRIRETGTGDMPVQSDRAGIFVRRDDLTAMMKRNQAVVRENITDLRSRPVPAGLTGHAAAVDTAAAEVDAAYPGALRLIGQFRSKIYEDDLADLQSRAIMSDFTTDYRRLGNALSNLAGQTCTIEAPTGSP
ncbi:hypothetical protein [Actinoplanes subglobosus]|uniref:Uncharacterized protein n=1 Tax=Actinoplanes subglobosus TaxID=1547892 RepID=A0ABV8IXV4_9ACTN